MPPGRGDIPALTPCQGPRAHCLQQNIAVQLYMSLCINIIVLHRVHLLIEINFSWGQPDAWDDNGAVFQ